MVLQRDQHLTHRRPIGTGIRQTLVNNFAGRGAAHHIQAHRALHLGGLNGQSGRRNRQRDRPLQRRYQCDAIGRRGRGVADVELKREFAFVDGLGSLDMDINHTVRLGARRSREPGPFTRIGRGDGNIGC